jgi:hypothetical protein
MCIIIVFLFDSVITIWNRLAFISCTLLLGCSSKQGHTIHHSELCYKHGTQVQLFSPSVFYNPLLRTINSYHITLALRLIAQKSALWSNYCCMDVCTCSDMMCTSSQEIMNKWLDGINSGHRIVTVQVCLMAILLNKTLCLEV